MTLPSTNSTIECTTLSGWITTSTCSGSSWNSQRASINFQGLVHQGGRVDRDLRAHPPGGMLEGVLGRDVASVPCGCVRGTGRRKRSGSRGAPPGATPAFRAWKIAECSLSTGRICVPRARASSMTSGPATTSVSLLARATILPASSAAQVPRRPTAPTIALKTRSVSRVLNHPDDAVQARQDLDARAAQLAFDQRSQLGIGQRDESRPMRDGLLEPSSSSGQWALKPHALSRAPPSCSITLMALRPIEPVEPRITT